MTPQAPSPTLVALMQRAGIHDANAPITADELDRLAEAVQSAGGSYGSDFDWLDGLALLTTDEACRKLHCSEPTIWRHVRTGRLSAPVKTGGKQSLWKASELAQMRRGER